MVDKRCDLVLLVKHRADLGLPVQEWVLAKSEPGRGEDMARYGTCCGARGEPLERIAGQRIADCDGFLFPRGQVDNGDGDCIAWNHWIYQCWGPKGEWLDGCIAGRLACWLHGWPTGWLA